LGIWKRKKAACRRGFLNFVRQAVNSYRENLAVNKTGFVDIAPNRTTINFVLRTRSTRGSQFSTGNSERAKISVHNWIVRRSVVWLTVGVKRKRKHDQWPMLERLFWSAAADADTHD
jgi:hypothetical protein